MILTRAVKGHDWALVAVLLLALGLRLLHVTANLPQRYWHDETNLIETALRLGSGTMEPFGLRHGMALPLLLCGLYGVSYGLQRLGGFVGSPEAFAMQYAHDATSFVIVGRVAVACFGVLLVALSYTLGRRLFSRAVGLMAATVMAVALLPVDMSIQIKEEVPAAVLLVWAFLRVVALKSSAVRSASGQALAIGVLLGLATAFKYTVGLSWVVVAPGLWDAARSKTPGTRLGTWARWMGWSVAGWFAGFIAGNPYAAWRPSFLIQSLADLYGNFVVDDGNPCPWLIAPLYHVPDSLGWPLALALAVGCVVLIIRRPFLGFLLCGYPLALWLVVGASAGYAYHLMPAIPFVVVAGAGGLALLGRNLSFNICGLNTHLRTRLVGAAFALLLVPSATHTWQLLLLLQRPDTRTLAKQWIETHIAPGTPILIEGAVDGELLNAPPLRADVATLTEDLARLQAGGAHGRLASVKLRLAQEEPGAIRYRLLKRHFLHAEDLALPDVDYIVTCGYFDRDVFRPTPGGIEEHQIFNRVAGFDADRARVTQRLTRAFHPVARFDPGLRLREFFPLLLVGDFHDLRSVPLWADRRDLFRGPLITIYRRNSSAKAVARVAGSMG